MLHTVNCITLLLFILLLYDSQNICNENDVIVYADLCL